METQTEEKELIECPECKGDGFTTESECCQVYYEWGCCGIPNPIQSQCANCKATGKIPNEPLTQPPPNH